MILSKKILKNITADIEVPSDKIFELPEKVLQFGTGVLLRALPDYYIDKANKQGIFNGRVVIVKSTSNGDTKDFDQQDGLYTICEKGIENGKVVERQMINASVSRVINANTEWEQILSCAESKEMQIVISNTTEVGIQLVANEDVTHNPPSSFPGKLTAFLYKRFQTFKGSDESGMYIVPTELITDNGTKLREIVIALAEQNQLEDAFIDWVKNKNTFCNTLVDRIVPGKPSAKDMQALVEKNGYTDDLYCDTEVFSLWAIEGDEKTKQALSFAQCDDNIVIQSDINLFRELKLRLLNATHTFNCGLAFLSDINLTRDAMLDEKYAPFVKNIMNIEIASSIPYPIDEKVKADFAHKVFERFCNPYINHQWISITAQYTFKVKMRCLPLIKQYHKLYNAVPPFMTLGFAAYLFFMKAVKCIEGKYYGEHNGKEYLINDDSAAYYFECWQKLSVADLVKAVINNEQLWGCDLKNIDGFEIAVVKYLDGIMKNGALNTISLMDQSAVLI